MNENQLLDAGLLNTIVLYTTAMMEVKSSMGVFVSAPTAGSCGTLPGAILGDAECLQSTEDEIIKSLLSAGIIGVFISEHATFAAEVAGCQAETGAGGSMAAAGLVTLMNGSLKQCIGAASLALQNSLGIVCDPIANRVEAPCLGKNIMAASNALCCADIAIDKKSKDMIIATHGRGIYKLNLIPFYDRIVTGLTSNFIFEIAPVQQPLRRNTHKDVEEISIRKVPITFWLSEAENINLSIMNTVDSLIRTRSIHGQKGFNQLLWDLVTEEESSDLPYFIHDLKYLGKGEYTFLLESSDGIYRRKFSVESH